MIDRVVEDRVPPGVVLADTAYGSCSQFRAHLRSSGLHYAVAVPPQTTVFLLNEKGRPRGDTRSVSDLALRIHERGLPTVHLAPRHPVVRARTAGMVTAPASDGSYIARRVLPTSPKRAPESLAKIRAA